MLGAAHALVAILNTVHTNGMHRASSRGAEQHIECNSSISDGPVGLDQFNTSACRQAGGLRHIADQ